MLDSLLQLDGGILLWIQEYVRSTSLSVVLAPYTMLGDAGLMWIALSLAMLCFRKTRKAGALALCAMALGMVVTNLTIKPLVSRPRPWLVVEGLGHIVEENDPNSFPSGHTCAAFAAGMIWLRTLPWRWGRITAVVLAALMGLSRLYVGVHYPSDVLAGAVIGALCAWVVWNVYQIYKRSRTNLRNAEER